MLNEAELQTLVLTSDLGKASEYYRHVLELPLVGEADGAHVFRVGSGVLRLSPVSEMEAGEHTVFGMAVADVRTVAVWLRRKGVEVVRFPGFPHDADGILVTPDGSKVIWLRDPDGNLISVVEFGAEG